MSNAPRPAEFRPEVAEIRETRCREEKYSSGEKIQNWGNSVRNTRHWKKLEQGGENHEDSPDRESRN